MPETTITIANLEASVQVVNDDLKGQIDDVNEGLALIARYNNEFADSGLDSMREFSRIVAAAANKDRKVKVSDTYVNNMVTRSVKFTNAVRNVSDEAFDRKVKAYQVKCLESGRKVTINGIVSLYVDTQGSKRGKGASPTTPRVFNATKVADKVAKDLNDLELAALINALVTLQSQRVISNGQAAA